MTVRRRRPAPWRVAGALTALAATVVTLAGCDPADPDGRSDTGPADGASASGSPTTGPSASDPASGEGAAVGTGGILPPTPSPLAPYLLQGADLYTIQAAEAELSGECLRRFGFEPVDLGLDRDAVIAEQRENDTRIYGITDLAEAEQFGYQPAALALDPVAVPTTSASYDFVYSGDRDGGVTVPQDGQELSSPGDFGGLAIPPGGCLGEARERLWGTPNPDVKDGFAQGLRISAYDAARADARVQRIFAAWSACMAEQGFRFQSPLEPRFSREPGSTPTAVEINTAVADIGCKEQTDLVAGWNRVDVEYQEQAIEDDQLQLSEEQRTIEDGVRNAAAVLHGD